jgi:elongation factor G
MHPIHPILFIEIVTGTDDERKIVEQQLRAIEADPTSGIAVQQLHCLLLVGEDELQLETVCERLQQTAPIGLSELRIGYRETIRRPVEAEGKYMRQTGGAGNYGHCWLRIEPNEPGKGNAFVDEIEAGAIPQQYIQHVNLGIRSAMELGMLAGFPMIDVKVTLFDGSYHETDSNEMAFMFAGSIAFKEAARKASPVLMEPVMAVAIDIPEQLAAAVEEDINARRGRIEKMDSVDGWCEIEALVPLAEVLRSSPHGRPEYSMRFARYQIAPRRDDRGDGDVAIPVLRPLRPSSRGGSASVPPDADEL